MIHFYITQTLLKGTKCKKRDTVYQSLRVTICGAYEKRHSAGSWASNALTVASSPIIISHIRVPYTSSPIYEFHGSTKSWDSITKAEYGTFLLDRALATLKLEGIRLITEDNLPDSLYPYVTNRRGAGGRTPKTPK